MKFKDKLKKLRLENKMTQAQLADKIYASRSAVAKWENGLGLPNEDSIEAICTLFNASREDFFNESIEFIDGEFTLSLAVSNGITEDSIKAELDENKEEDSYEMETESNETNKDILLDSSEYKYRNMINMTRDFIFSPLLIIVHLLVMLRSNREHDLQIIKSEKWKRKAIVFNMLLYTVIFVRILDTTSNWFEVLMHSSMCIITDLIIRLYSFGQMRKIVKQK